MKSLKVLSVALALTSSASAFAYETCTTTDRNAVAPQILVNVESDAGHVEALVVSANAHSFNFYPAGPDFNLDSKASQSPGFVTIKLASDKRLAARQSSDTGRLAWILYTCR